MLINNMRNFENSTSPEPNSFQELYNNLELA